MFCKGYLSVVSFKMDYKQMQLHYRLSFPTSKSGKTFSNDEFEFYTAFCTAF